MLWPVPGAMQSFLPLKIFNAVRDLKPELVSLIWVPFSLEVCTLLVLLCPAKLLFFFFFSLML